MAGITFQPIPTSPGVRLSVQSIPSLGPWEDVATRPAGAETWTIVQAGTELTVDGAHHTVRVPTFASPRQYLRLRAERE